MSVSQNSIPHFALFEVQNEQQVRLYNANCSIPAKAKLSFLIQDGVVIIEITNATKKQTYVISVKYDTGSIVGEIEPGGEISYLFETDVEGFLSGKDHLVLMKR